MFIPEFWCGVAATLVVEFVTLFVWAIFKNNQNKK